MTPGSAPSLSKTGSAGGPAIARSPVVNAMSVDVEDYFQVQAFADRVRRADWDGFECRVERNTRRILELFSAGGVKATFFSLGWVAERYPGLIRAIVDGGHELASHGYEHRRVHEQSPEQFRNDVRKTKRLLEDIGGAPVIGYRAASFSIGAQTPWAHDILGEEGYRYSSSIYPIRHDLYGVPDAPRFPYRPGDAHIIEIPMSTVEILGQKRPCSGGGYFRLLPYRLSRWAIDRINRKDAQPCVFYFHPWEIDPAQPRIRASLKSRFRHQINLARMERRLERLLRDFRWDRLDRVFLKRGSEPA